MKRRLELIFSSSLIDIAIGAFKSNQAAVLRSRPVIQVVGSVRTTRKTINLDEKQCVTEFGKMPWFWIYFLFKTLKSFLVIVWGFA